MAIVCDNQLELLGDRDTVRQFADLLWDGRHRGALSAVVPLPTEDEQRTGLTVEERCLRTWGVGHDIGPNSVHFEDEGDDIWCGWWLTLRFRTDCDPPLRWLQAVSAKHPDIQLKLSFDVDEFGLSGTSLYDGGQEVERRREGGRK